MDLLGVTFVVSEDYILSTVQSRKTREFQLNREVLLGLCELLKDPKSIPETRASDENTSKEDEDIMYNCHENWSRDSSLIETDREQTAYRHTYVGSTDKLSLYLSKFGETGVILLDIKGARSTRVSIYGFTGMGTNVAIEYVCKSMIKEIATALGIHVEEV